MIRTLLYIFLFCPFLVFGDTPKGEKFVYRLWNDVQAGRMKKIYRYTSHHFQGVNKNSVFNRKQEIAYLKNLHIKSFQIISLRVTEGENVITAGYLMTMIQSPELKTVKQPNEQPVYIFQNDVWKKTGDTWKWVAGGTSSF